MYDAISSMVTPVSLIEAWTRASRLRLSIDATLGESLGLAELGGALGVFFGVIRLGVAG